ncbi:MAG: transcriptional regulator [Leptolyngbyaceae cyanobacterium SM1_3_5]|nr:transcriptional regulator [Leptolyngbyaceae cyanobacterium SM1_3_5]
MSDIFNPEKYRDLLSQYQPKLIRTEEENERALVIVEELMNRHNRSPEENELYDLLIALIEKFEQEFYQPGQPTTRSMLQFLMEQQDLSINHLAEVLGSETIAAKILNGEQEMTIAQVKTLSKLCKVEPSVFL